jgi:hypothetical protein
MKTSGMIALLMGFDELDRQIEKFRALRDSYRAANAAYFGAELASYLDQ